MGKYTGLVLCCDIDGTFIDDNVQIPQANLDALRYFRSEGGKFTVCTGRTLSGAMFYLEKLKTDTPMVCQNGSAIYNQKTDEFLWLNPLPEKAYELIEYVENRFPHMGIEVITPREIYFYRESHATYLHQTNEDLPVILTDDYKKIAFPWAKIVFADMPEKVDEFQAFMEKTKYNGEFKLIRSHTIFYEAVNKTTNKGVALEKFRELMNLDYEKIIVAGDNDNDIEMLRSPALSFAPANAFENARNAADIVLKSDNNAGILPEMLEYINKSLNL